MLSNTSRACCVKGSVMKPRGGQADTEKEAAACIEDEEDEDKKGGAVAGVRLAADTALRHVLVTSIGCVCERDG